MNIPVSFQQPVYFFLFLLLPVFIYIYLKSRQKFKGLDEKISLYIRIFIVTLLILALTQPILSILGDDMNIVILADRSDSLTEELKEEQEEFITHLLNEKEETDKFSLATFAREAVVEFMPGRSSEFVDFNSYIENNFTNLESGLRLALSLTPEKGNNRVVLLSDGNENIGSAETVLQDYLDRDIKIDVLPLAQEGVQEVFVREMNLPEWVDPGEVFNINLNIASTIPTEARINLYYDEQLIQRDSVSLNQGDNIYLLEQELEEGGFHKYRIEVSSETDTYTENNSQEAFVIVKGSKRVLLVSESDSVLNPFINALESSDINVDLRSPNMFSFTIDDLQVYDSIIMNNIHADLLSSRQMDNINTYVHELGGGLVVIGGRNSLGAGGYNETQLNNILPLNSNLRSKTIIPETTLLVVLDKSGSMEAGDETGRDINRLDLAKEGTLAILDILNQEEKLGIVAFDQFPGVVFPIQVVEDKRSVVDQFSVLEPGGGTDIYKALEKARELLQDDRSSIKHVILLSDGHSNSTGYQEIINNMSAEGITVSTVAVGGEVDKDLMSQLANWGGGRYYYTNNADDLPQIFVNETRRIVRNPIIEKEFSVEAVSNVDFLNNIDFSTMPTLNGYIATTPKPLADVYLVSDEKYPVLAGWRYGLGRVITYTSDLGSEFSGALLNWEEYPRFWSSIVNQVVRVSYSDNIFPTITRSGDQGIIQVDAITDTGNYYNFLDMEARISSSANQTRTTSLEQVGPGLYRGMFDIVGENTYLVALNWEEEGEEESLSTGLAINYSPEYRDFFAGEGLVKTLTEETGGRIINSVDELYSARQLSYVGEEEIWQELLIAALILFIVDVGLRVVELTVLKRIWDSFRGFISHSIDDFFRDA
ncbi:MAG: VWA domain-containing protein [Halanaerobiales bacterium]